ncbi:MAG: imelysin family protein [Bacteroidota bacterium]|nr:imelysin family protein [Bacteroidota bacterium]
MKRSILFFISGGLFFGACHKASVNNISTDFATLETQVITDFTNNVALGQYSALTNAAVSLNQSITQLNTATNDVNLQAARTSWKNIRGTWEQCEGFLFGPVEDNDYDPNTDTWPTDYNQMDSLLASGNALQTDDIKNLPQSLRGYHPLEYIIFGKAGSRTASGITPRQKRYMVSLSADILYNNVQPLYNDWSSGYKNEVLTAGNGSTQFQTKQQLFLNIVSGMSDICDEVGSNKMFEPFVARDSTITESPYSSNTLDDFRNNIVGLQNVYLGLNNGKGIQDLVAAKNQNLNNQIKTQIQSAISSFSNITLRYEQAIYNQRTQVQQTMDQLATLKDLLDNELTQYITQNVKD